MTAPSPKQRAVTMKRNGMDDSLVGAVLGISAEDVRSLLYDANPDVSLAAGGGVPGQPVDVTPALIESDVPLQSTVTELADLAARTAPTDAPAYIFTGQVVLRARNEQPVSLRILGPTDTEAFDFWWNGPSTDPLRESHFRLENDGADYVWDHRTVEYLVGAGETIYFMRVGELQQPDPTTDAMLVFNGTFWIPVE